MYAQLGSIVFELQNGFTSFSINGNEANFAEFELINSKPRLQKLGDSLQELSIGLTLQSKFINIQATILALETYKSDGEISPLLMGNGVYLGDFVIISNPYSIVDAFADGTIIEASLTLTLKEFVGYNKLEQKKSADRKKAFAVGNKKNIVLRPPAPLTLKEASAQNITEAKIQSIKIDSLVTEIENNPSKKEIIADKIKNTAVKTKEVLIGLISKIDNNSSLFSVFPNIKTKANDLIGNIEQVISIYPFTSVDTLKNINTALQASNRSFAIESTLFLKKIIIRQNG